MRLVPAASIAAFFLVFTVPVLATTQTGPFAVKISASPNPYAIEGTTSVSKSAAVLGESTGTGDSALEGYAEGQDSAGLEGFAQSSGGTESNGVYGYAANGYGVYGQAQSDAYSGVLGLNLDASGGGTGVTGKAGVDGSGVLGQGGGFGVEGITTNNGYGVYGADESTDGNSGVGVAGAAYQMPGVEGYSQNAAGVLGDTKDSLNLSTLLPNTIGNSSGVLGDDETTSSDVEGNAGVTGTSTNGFGVVGMSSNGNGIRAISNVGTALVAETSSGFVGQAIDAYSLNGADVMEAYAAPSSSSALVHVMSLDASGDMILAGGLTQHGTPASTVRDTRGAERVAYSQRATEATIEDFGRAQMVGGRAEVRLDPTFASTLADADYLVFLTGRGDSNTLYVAGASLGGFEIREHGGASTLAIDYRIVGHPRAERPESRLALLPQQRSDQFARATPPTMSFAAVHRAIEASIHKSVDRLSSRMLGHAKHPAIPAIFGVRPDEYGPRMGH